METEERREREEESEKFNDDETVSEICGERLWRCMGRIKRGTNKREEKLGQEKEKRV